MNDPALVRCVAISDQQLHLHHLSIKELLESYGIDPSKPFRGYDAGNGMHIYKQTLEDVIKGVPIEPLTGMAGQQPKEAQP